MRRLRGRRPRRHGRAGGTRSTRRSPRASSTRTSSPSCATTRRTAHTGGTPRRVSDEDRGDQAEVPGALRGERAHGRAVRPAARSTTRTCCSSTPAWCSSCRTSWASATAPYPRAVSVQKCIRTPGHRRGRQDQPARHVLPDERQLLVRRLLQGGRDRPRLGAGHQRRSSKGGFGLDPERIWATVYLDDDEAIEHLAQATGLPAERIVRRGKKDNFWSMGIPGPAGPCSEIYYDRGPEYGPEGGPEVDEDRYLEFWNLVFMQYEITDVKSKEDFRDRRRAAGEEHRHRHGPGAHRVDPAGRRQPVRDRRGPADPGPGGGADRQGATARTPATSAAESHPDDVRLRVIADHVRTALMLIGDGVTPSNEGRGYVLRRIMRRAIRAMRLLGWQGGRRCRSCCRWRATAWRRPIRSWPRSSAGSPRTRTREEEAFLSTLRAGTTILDTAIAETKKSRRARSCPARKAFQLHDTYGFPIDLTLEIAAEQGLDVDQDGFRRLMAEQRHRAKADAAARKTGHADLSAYRSVLDAGGPVEFTGYAEVARESKVRALLGDGRHARRGGRRGRRRRAGARRDPVLRRGRRPAARHRPDQRRRRPGRGRRRAAAAAGPDRAPGAGRARRGARGRDRASPRST